MASLLVDTEQHDDEQEQHDDRTGINDDLHRGQELRVLLDEQHRHAEQCHHQHEGGVDRVACKHDAERAQDANGRGYHEGDRIGDGGGENVGHLPRTLPPKRLGILSRSTVRIEMFPVARSSRLPLWPPSGARTP